MSTASMIENAAVVVPMPRASVSSATAVNPGARRYERSANRASPNSLDSWRLNTASSVAWMVAAGSVGSKIVTFGPKSGSVASGVRRSIRVGGEATRTTTIVLARRTS
jgi:hypothetical protein